MIPASFLLSTLVDLTNVFRGVAADVDFGLLSVVETTVLVLLDVVGKVKGVV